MVDCSTIDPEVERAQHARVAETGARYLDAPLSGGTAGAQKGTLTLMVGGDADMLADVDARRSSPSPGSWCTWAGPAWARSSSFATTSSTPRR